MHVHEGAGAVKLTVRLDTAKPGSALNDLYEALMEDDSVRMHAAPQLLPGPPEADRLSLSAADALALFIAASDAIELSRRVARVVERWRHRHEETVASITLARGDDKVSIPLDALTAERFGALIEQFAVSDDAQTQKIANRDADVADDAAS